MANDCQFGNRQSRRSVYMGERGLKQIREIILDTQSDYATQLRGL